MDLDKTLIFEEYKLYTTQKENFIDRNFRTNRFYMTSFMVIIISMIFTGQVVFMGRISATLLFSALGIAVCSLWWMNVDSYNTLIKIKYGNIIEKMEEALPAQPFTEEAKGIKEFRDKKIFMFSDVQKLIAVLGALFCFVIFVTEITPVIAALWTKIYTYFSTLGGGNGSI